MKDQRYMLDFETTIDIDSRKMIIPSLDGEYVKNREEFFDIPGHANKVFEENKEFDYLIPRYSDEYIEVEFLCDFHSWIGEKPSFFSGIPISKRMKEIVEKFNLYPNKFYEAKVMFKGEYHEYYIWQFFLDGFNKFVDLENSTFCEWKMGLKVDENIINVKSEKELRRTMMYNNWRGWGFERAVMKKEYKDIDAAKLAYPYGILISERLKNALERAELTGFKITSFPMKFEYL
ncbi:hypothetical protein [uncultured Tenacibaculum sp.]|uniref:hypothetical protein n=1 Tax=uncultured Tenacibaculum sp. TaxID=174713 RepID=UPI0026129034|nr:hypothetical protein [uncultured Tenacibaculum sp.]